MQYVEPPLGLRFLRTLGTPSGPDNKPAAISKDIL
jgi:hypothetical protein